MLQIALDPEFEKQLAAVAERVGEAPDEIARKALRAYVEDLEDYAIAVEAWRAHDPASTVSSEDMLRELRLAD